MGIRSTRTPLLALAAAMLALVVFSAGDAGAAGYPRPKGASPLRSPMIPVYERCQSGGGRIADLLHGAPLAYPACSHPEQISGELTIGTNDANGKNTNSVGYVLYTVVPGDPATAVDEADVRIDFSMSDVRRQDGLADYAGTLELSVESRITDRSNGPGQDEPGTTDDFFYTAVIPCAATGDTTIGGTCALKTTADALVPDTVKEGKRTIWAQADHTHIFDSGPDGDALTEDDNLLFATQGVFIP